MNLLKPWKLLISFIVISSCSKTDTSPSNTLVGTWIFTSQYTQSFSYPSMLTNPYPFSVSSYTIAMDSIQLSFHNIGNYSFTNLRTPIDHGTYSVFQDSLLIIEPDTSGLIKFSYNTLTLSFSSQVSPPPLPYQNFKFTSDTIFFKANTNNLILTTIQLSKPSTPIQPAGDTIVISQCITNFRGK